MKDIWKYSLPQIYAFFAMAISHKRDTVNTEVVGVRVAYHGDSKAFDKYIGTD